jgi:DNA-binding transcriptional LysR family regulator
LFKYSLRQLEYFAKTAETLSLAVAARELHISQPSISTAITKLEDGLDVQLFKRHHAQGVSLTSAGARLLIEVKALLSHSEDLQQSALGLATQMRGRLHIGCFGPISALYLPSIITGFQALYPEVELNLYEADTDTLLSGIEENRYDVALVYQLDVPTSMKSETLLNLKPHVIVAPDHPLANQGTVSLKALAKHSMVLLDLPRSREYFSSLFEAHNLTPTVSMRSPSFETVRSLVANGAGFSVLVTRPTHNTCYDGKKVVQLEFSDDIPLTTIVLVHSNNTRQTRLHSTFVAYCQSQFALLTQT